MISVSPSIRTAHFHINHSNNNDNLTGEGVERDGERVKDGTGGVSRSVGLEHKPRGKSTKRQRTEESTGVMTFIRGMLQLKWIRKKKNQQCL